MEKQCYTVGARADKLCAICNEERGHVVTAVTKRGQISRVNCPKCGTVSNLQTQFAHNASRVVANSFTL